MSNFLKLPEQQADLPVQILKIFLMRQLFLLQGETKEAGDRYGSSLYGAGGEGSYWSSTPSEGNDDYACSLYFFSDNLSMYYDGHRYYGLTVRPVLE